MSARFRSILQCPRCGFKVTEGMSKSYCVLRYQCPACGFELSPTEAGRCVFCCHGSVACPDFQLTGQCCAAITKT